MENGTQPPAPTRFVPLTPGQKAEARSFFGPLPTVSPPPLRTATPVSRVPAAKKGVLPLPILDASGKVTGYTDVKVRQKRGPRKAKPVAAPAPATRKSGGRRTKRSLKEVRAVAGAQILLQQLRALPKNSKEYMAKLSEIRAARRAESGGKTAGKSATRRSAAAAAPAAAKKRARKPAAEAVAAPTPVASKPARKKRKTKPAPAAQEVPGMAIVPVAPKPEKKRKTKEQIEKAEAREKHRESLIGQVETQFDKHRQIVRAVTIVSVAVGAVKLNQQYPDGFTPLALEASTIGAIGAGVLSFLARRFGWRRTSSTLVDVGLGFVTGTLSSNVGSGKTPLIAKKAA